MAWTPGRAKPFGRYARPTSWSWRYSPRSCWHYASVHDQPLVSLGNVIIDIVAEVPALPESGGDVLASGVALEVDHVQIRPADSCCDLRLWAAARREPG